MKVTVPLPLPNKANRYQVHFHPQFWQAIRRISEDLKRYVRGPLYWIGPEQVVKDTQIAIAYAAKLALEDDLGDVPIRLEIWISRRLDADSIKAILEGIQLSGRIKDDRQVSELIVHKVDMKNESFSFDITKIERMGNEAQDGNPPGSLPRPGAIERRKAPRVL